MAEETPREADLIRRLNKGEERAFETVFHKYYASLCFFANKFLKDNEAAKDIVQDVFVLLYEKKYQFLGKFQQDFLPVFLFHRYLDTLYNCLPSILT